MKNFYSFLFLISIFILKCEKKEEVVIEVIPEEAIDVSIEKVDITEIFICKKDKDCDDGKPCTIDKCDKGICFHNLVSEKNQPFVCDDKNPCTTDLCDEKSFECLNKCDEGKECNDGDSCTLNDKCVEENGVCSCKGKYPLPEDDLNPCTFDYLDKITCKSVHECIEDKECDDGDNTTINDKCKIKEDTNKCVCTGEKGKCTLDEECDDGNPCTFDVCKDEKCEHNCNFGISCDDQSPLTVNDVCLEVEGKCQCKGKKAGCFSNKDCEDGNPCTDDVCFEGVECKNFCQTGFLCEDGNLSTVNDTCVNKEGECLCEGNEVSCFEDKYCNDNNLCTAEACDNGMCIYKCEINLLCDDGNEETNLDICQYDNGKCYCEGKIVKKCKANKDCIDYNLCTNDICENGNCMFLQVNCDDNNPKTKDDCEPKKGCIHEPVVCNDQNPCTDDKFDPASDSCIFVQKNCDDKNLCTIDYCEMETGNCVNKEKVCIDENLCTDDSCENGECVFTEKNCSDNDPATKDFCDLATGKCGHEPIVCDDNDPCTDDKIDPEKGCVNIPKDCKDKNLCTDDYCDIITGLCANKEKNCKDDNLCTEDFCDTTTGLCVNEKKDCEDYNLCTDDACDMEMGLCVNKDKDCKDTNLCTDDYCDMQTGNCVNKEKICDDKNLCTDDACENGECIFIEKNCDDNDASTTDFCNPENGQCVHTQIICDDNDLCTDDKTDPVKGCIFTAKICDDKNPCTDDSCDKATGLCVFTDKKCEDNIPCTKDYCKDGVCFNDCETGLSCDDGNSNTVFDTCKIENELCVCSGKPPECLENKECEDNNLCTENKCENYKCIFLPVPDCCLKVEDCDDKNICTENKCENNKCVFVKIPKCCLKNDDCDDKNQCTSDVCIKNQCVNYNVTIPCDDGNACTENDKCGEGKCHGGTPKVCEDNIPCTINSCDKNTGCKFTPDNSKCNDNNECTDNICDAGKGCLYPPVLNGTSCGFMGQCVDGVCYEGGQIFEGTTDQEQKVSFGGGKNLAGDEILAFYISVNLICDTCSKTTEIKMWSTKENLWKISDNSFTIDNRDIDGNGIVIKGGFTSEKEANGTWEYKKDKTCGECNDAGGWSAKFVNKCIKPLAEFEGTPLTVKKGGKVTFTNKSKFDYDTCFWDFPTGNPSSSSICNNLEISYTTPGAKDIQLFVGGLCGPSSIKKTGYIKVED